MRQDSALRASGSYCRVNARKNGLPPIGSTMGNSATSTKSKFFVASCMGFYPSSLDKPSCRESTAASCAAQSLVPLLYALCGLCVKIPIFPFANLSANNSHRQGPLSNEPRLFLRRLIPKNRLRLQELLQPRLAPLSSIPRLLITPKTPRKIDPRPIHVHIPCSYPPRHAPRPLHIPARHIPRKPINRIV